MIRRLGGPGMHGAGGMALSDIGASCPSAPAGWWLSGGVAAANCIAAYQAKGAANLAASYVNLANPGTFDAGPGVAPGWAAGVGWIFNGVNQYLRTFFVPAILYSLFVQFTGYVTGGVTGDSNDGLYWFGLLTPWSGAGAAEYWQGNGLVTVAPGFITGNIGVAGNQGYRNGVADGGAIASGGVTFTDFYIGCADLNGGPANYTAVTVVAYAYYDIVHPDPAALVTAMAAL